MRSDSRVRERVYSAIRRQIVEGKLQPDTPLVVTRLAGVVKASRTPVREALLQLLSDGLVARSPGGLVVKGLTEEEILGLHEIRVPLEATAARLAALHMTSLDLVQIEALHEKAAKEVRSAQPDIAWVAAMNLEFHRLICQTTRNPLLQEFTAKVHDAMGRIRHTAFHRPKRLSEITDEHGRLVAALRARDPDSAEQVARAHMQRALQVRLEVYRQQQRNSAGASLQPGGGVDY